MPNLDLVEKTDVSSFRKIALGTWQTVGDPSVYGTITLRMERALAYIEGFRRRTGKRVTVSHLMAKAVALTLKEMPDANAVLRRNRIYLRKVIGVFFQVAMTDEGHGKADLSGATLYNVDKMSITEIVDEFQHKCDQVRARKDKALEKTRNSFLNMPYRLLGPVLNAIGWLSYEMNFDLRWAGIPSDPFGSIMITNVGSLGLDVAYVPLVPYSRVPMLLALGAVKDAAVVDDGKVVVGKVMNVNATFDHRIIDGFHCSVMSKCLRQIFDDPEAAFGRIDELPAQESALRIPSAASASSTA